MSIPNSIAVAAAARSMRIHRVFAAIIAAATAAAVCSPIWAETPLDPAHPNKSAASAPDLNTDGSAPNSVARAGAQTLVATVWDCEQPTLFPVVWARVEHGSVRVRTGTGRSCGKPSMGLTYVFYTSERGFKGTDHLYLLGFLAKGDLNQTYTILVK